MVQRETAKLRVGSIFRDIYFPYWGTIAQGIINATQDLGIELVLPLHTAEEEDLCAVVAREVVDVRPDVMLVQQNVLEFAPQLLDQLNQAGIPAIGVECKPDPRFRSVVYADEAQGTRQVLGHLFERMNYSGKLVNIHGAHIRTRQSTLKALLPDHPDIELVYEAPGFWTEADGYRIMRDALEQHPDVTGVFAHNDFMAVGACRAIREAGLSDQISVVGFDADPTGILAIYQDELSATVYRNLFNVGYRAVQAAQDIMYYQDAPFDICMPTQLICKENLIDATIDTVRTLPNLLETLIRNGQEQRRLQQETIDAQRRIIHELSTPVIPLSKDVLIMPLIGLIDSTRAQQIMDSMLFAVRDHSASFVIVDITGISMIDTQIAHHLIQSARAVQLLGAEVLLVGINPEVAQALVGLGIEFGAITTRSSLHEGLRYAQQKLKRPLL